jgi:hypothetical protein
MFYVVLGDLEAIQVLLTERLHCLITAIKGEELGVFREVVEQGGRLIEEQRQVVLDAGRGQSLADIAIDYALLRITLKLIAIGLTELLDRLLGERELACRQQADLLDLLLRALAVHIEGADALHLIVE